MKQWGMFIVIAVVLGVFLCIGSAWAGTGTQVDQATTSGVTFAKGVAAFFGMLGFAICVWIAIAQHQAGYAVAGFALLIIVLAIVSSGDQIIPTWTGLAMGAERPLVESVPWW